jgi:hypothetical protein
MVEFSSLNVDQLARGTRTRPKSDDKLAHNTMIKHVEKIFERAPARRLRCRDSDANRANR